MYIINYIIPKIGVGSVNSKFPKLIKPLNVPKYKISNKLINLDNMHELAHSLDDVETMINNELDRKTGDEKSNKTILIYMIIGLLMFSLFYYKYYIYYTVVNSKIRIDHLTDV